MTEVSEREAIVAWLREEAIERSRRDCNGFGAEENAAAAAGILMLMWAAAEIERGDHLNPENIND